ncbi:MAG: hypothetical protein M3O15_13410 [Acidobacteriota bacterium]|nr:hypothetical protein [Acidobacteriota bacterium]
MREKLTLLESSLRSDLAAIDGLYAALGPVVLEGHEPEEKLMVIAYRLHNTYTAFENLFRNIAACFENSLDDRSGWHRQGERRVSRAGERFEPLPPTSPTLRAPRTCRARWQRRGTAPPAAGRR